jgi:PAS domain S-box-containing protein
VTPHPVPSEWFLGAVFLNDCAKAVLAALLLKRFMADPIRFNSMRDFGIYCLVAVLLVPLLSAFGGAAARIGLGHEFWGSLEQWFLGNAMANLIVTPVLFYWVLRPPNPATFSAPRSFEAAILVLGLMITLALAFEPIAGPRDFAEWRYYAPLPFIVWAAIRFRMFGASAAVALLTVFAVVAAIEGSGSFANLSPEETSSRLQHFLLLRAAPLYLVAVLIEQTWQVGSSLRKSEQRYRAVVESQTDFLCRFRPDTTLTFVNAAYCGFIGKPRAELLGVRLLDLLPGAAREAAREGVARALAHSEQAAWECEVAYPDGARGWQHWVCHTIESTPDEGSELQAIGHDITDRKRAEESGRQLAHATRFAAVGELTAMVAHEINQPLCAILSNAEAAELLLQTQQPPLQEIREILADIRKDDLRADAAIRSIRSLLHRREFQPRPVDVTETVNHVLTLIAGDALHRRVQVRRELAADLSRVIGDPSHLEQVLVILIVNGMDAMKNTPEAARELTITARRAAESLVEIAIQDRGHGIAPASMPQLFDSFFTTKADGMGLGLSIARSMIAAHGGTIWAENAPEGGAIFRFTLCVDARGAGA